MGNSATVDAGQEQHLRALEYANRVRLARARMKRRIAAGELTEGYAAIASAWRWAREHGVTDLPLLGALHAVVWEGARVGETMARLTLAT